jgi:hypothetical protein
VLTDPPPQGTIAVSGASGQLSGGRVVALLSGLLSVVHENVPSGRCVGQHAGTIMADEEQPGLSQD